jgi:hypothetical protein
MRTTGCTARTSATVRRSAGLRRGWIVDLPVCAYPRGCPIPWYADDLVIGATIGRCVVVLALLAGCYEPHYVEGLFCSTKGDCPPDQECTASGRCYYVPGAGPDGRVTTLDVALQPDAPTGNNCSLLTQAGCTSTQKCTWIMDAMTPQYVGHIGCAPSGTAAMGDTCMMGAPGASGYDNCGKGLMCGNYRGTATGTCKAICDLQGGTPGCDSQRACVSYAGLFAVSGVTDPVAGVCDITCDPLGDNDFDGAGTTSSKTASTCGSLASVGCYGFPSLGTAPLTAWTCTNDINVDQQQPIGLRHRVQCLEANSCADPGPTIYTNSCNQGYLPLLEEQTGSTQVICVSMCKPAICYSGNCGASNTNRNGDPASLHQCTTAHRKGTFAATEHCQYLWWREIDGPSGTFLRSPTSDTVGFCMDFQKYRYDSNGDSQVTVTDMLLPNCDQLGSASVTGGNPQVPTSYFGAPDLGCVPSSFLGLPATGKAALAPEALQKRALTNLPRALYHRTVR